MLLPSAEGLVGGLGDDGCGARGTMDEGMGGIGPVGSWLAVGVGRVCSSSGTGWPKYGAAEGNPSISENLRNWMTLSEAVFADTGALVAGGFETNAFVAV